MKWSWWRIKDICSKIFHDWYLYPKLQPILRRGSRSESTGVGFPASPLEFSEIGYLLLPSRNMAERSLNRRQSSKQPTNQPTSRVSKSYVSFKCIFPLVMHFVPILHRRCRSKTNFHFFSYDIFPCSIHGEIKKSLIWTMWEEESNWRPFSCTKWSRVWCRWPL